MMKTLLDVSPAQRLVSVAEMQAIEKATDAGGHSYAAMMEIAGNAVGRNIVALCGIVPVLVLVGPGNNGGDGLVCARYLQRAGAPVVVYLWKRRTDPERDYEGHFAAVAALGIPTARAEEDEGLAILREWLGRSSIVVDALLGTGAKGPIEGLLADVLRTVAAQHVPSQTIVAVDCASGIDCDTGALSPQALIPHITVTFGFAKHGHFQFPGADAVGKLIVADIGIPHELAVQVRTFLITQELVQAWLPPRPRLSHKGTFGKLLLIVGSESYPGAAYLSCAAAGRTGAGLVTGAVPKSIWALLAGRLAEPTWLPLPVREGGELEGWLDETAAALVIDKASSYDALVLGCGLGKNDATRAYVEQLLAQSLPPAVVDADGLNCLAELSGGPQRLRTLGVLTPHPAEMARLCALDVQEVVQRRWELARERAATWGQVVLLKGPYTVIADPQGWLGVLPIATPALATAGSGDVLAGMIGSLLAQRLDPFAAACTGSWLHGTVGLRCEQEIGPAGVVASDLLVQLPAVLRALHRGAHL
jgi:NAD(P)H-hydrate epimerase